MGKYWHPHCLVCKSCRQPLNGNSFSVFRKKLYHPQCLRCPGCKKTITNEYVDYKKMPWHPDCVPSKSGNLCSVCKKPLSRRYFVDFWGNPYCDQHKNHPECSSCGRLVCNNLTDGGMQ
ncbi:MAG: LIM domain-containing protein, partial [Endozoicomonas sp.]